MRHLVLLWKLSLYQRYPIESPRLCTEFNLKGEVEALPKWLLLFTDSVDLPFFQSAVKDNVVLSMINVPYARSCI